ncbi:MAG: glycosyltransferase [Candidatus Magasanikbacteria bacterium]|nr:glycosyltransferase [Candidatus Magasanikbacteria bacterium]
MKILITGTVGESLPPPYAGIPKLTMLWAREWARSGHKIAITFVHRHDHEDDLGAGGEYFFEFASRPNKFKKILFLLKWFFADPRLYFRLHRAYARFFGLTKEGIMYSSYGVWLGHLIKKFQPDLILGQAALVKSFMAAHLAREHGIPFVLAPYAEVHWLSNSRGENIAATLGNYWRYFLSLPEVVLTCSWFCSNGSLLYAPPEKVEVIYPGIDVGLYTGGGSGVKQKMREKFGLPPEAFIVLAVGAYTPRKGHDHIIDAVHLLREQGRDIFIALCGAGNPNWLLARAADYGMSDRLKVFQKLSEQDLIDLYKTADIYCDASTTERACLGMSLTEAMSSGLPVVGYSIGGLPEVIHENENGFLAPFGNRLELGKAILKMKQLSGEERERLGREGVAVAGREVDIKVAQVKVMAALERAVQR